MTSTTLHIIAAFVQRLFTPRINLQTFIFNVSNKKKLYALCKKSHQLKQFIFRGSKNHAKV